MRQAIFKSHREKNLFVGLHPMSLLTRLKQYT